MLVVLSMMLFGLGKFIDPKYGVVLFGLIGVPTAGCAFIFPPAMLSEIAAKSTKDTNINLEGMHFGIQGFFLKLAFLVSVGFVPLLLVSNGFSEVFTSIATSSTTVEVNGIYTTTLFAAISFVLSFIFYYKYEEIIPELD